MIEFDPACLYLAELVEEAPIPVVERADFIKAMRLVSSSVSVVTTDGVSGRFGATVSAFCSLSADPPSLLICLNSASRITKAVAANRAFCLNLLPEDSQDLAARFAGLNDAENNDRFKGVDWVKSQQAVPVIKGATAFTCLVQNALDHGSHQIFIGAVTEIQITPAMPLTYLDGAYHRVVPAGRPDDQRCGQAEKPIKSGRSS